MDATFSNALRELLIAQVDAMPRRRRLARWRWGIGAALVAGLLGGGSAVAAQLIVQPGGEVHAQLAAPASVSETGTATIPLGPRPAGARQVYLTFAPLDSGRYALGRGGASTDSATSYYLQLSELDPGGTSLTITAAPTLRWNATVTWVSATTTAWAVNASGQSYGVQNAKGSPDLIAVTATNGKDGYVYRTALEDADGTTAAKSFTSPQQALDWQKAREGKRFEIPVYRSDGTTKIGVFVIGP
jgi:hypothetical protein